MFNLITGIEQSIFNNCSIYGDIRHFIKYKNVYLLTYIDEYNSDSHIIKVFDIKGEKNMKLILTCGNLD